MNDFNHIVCPECLAVNRVPLAKPADAATCGKCRSALFTGHPVALSAAGFKQHLERNDIPLLVDFWAGWCGPCKTMAPVFERAAGELEPALRLAKLDTEAVPEVATRLNIRSIPTLVLFRGGREIARQTGVMDLSALLAWIQGQRYF